MDDNNKIGKLVIMGDLFPIPSNYDRFSNGSVDLLFGDQLCDLLAQADYRICNLEGALFDGKDRCVKSGPYYVAPKSTINAIKKLGINCCALANNHITDAGHQGVVDTFSELEKNGIAYFGAGINSNLIEKSKTICINGLKIGLYNVAETMFNAPSETQAGVNLYDEYLVCKDLEYLKAQNDYVIVLYHGGIENFQYPSPEMRKRAHRMADSGADMILFQHTHCIGCEEEYNDTYILYGQGNFLFKSFVPGITDEALVLELFIQEGEVLIKKHRVCAISDYTRYDEQQNLNSLYERSSHLDDDAYLQSKFHAFCMKELSRYICAFNGKRLIIRIGMRFGKNRFKKYFFPKLYKRQQLLFTLHTLRSEQNRETAIEGLSGLFKQMT